MDHDPDPTLLQTLAAELCAQTGADAFYVFWFGGGAPGTPAPPDRQRVLLAFPSPDAALSFAQRSVRRGQGEQPRLRRLGIPQLLQAVACEPAIAALILVAEGAPDPPPGQLPAGLRLEREDILRRLAA
ncbi:MAG TPA: hypothetical protein VNL77_24630 [Roseiflexaceae bacterium]|nr:hypothetical protein [Roseiflexaceae bacterium]